MGYEKISISGFKLSVNLAGFFLIVILIFIYLQCYRSARVIHRQLLDSYEDDELDQNVSFLKTRSSIFNPFLNSERRGKKGTFSDYLGIFVINIPPILISVVFGILLFNKVVNVVPEQMIEMFNPGQLLGLASISLLFSVLSFLFYIIFCMFLWKIYEIIMIVNKEDDFRRFLLMFSIPISFFIISFLIQSFMVTKFLISLGGLFITAFN
jgi:hypothetical protein